MTYQNNNNLKNKAISGVIWSSVQRFGTLIISFTSNIVLARLLTPDDFGYIGMLMVFIAVATILVDGGFSTALIQKKEPNKEDLSTIFVWNLFFSTTLYAAIFVAAPYIATFYKMPDLSSILQVLGIMLIINAFSTIQNTLYIRQLNFKLLAQTNLISTTVGTIVGIVLALYNWGVWSLVVKQLVTNALQTIILWAFSYWRPSFIFSIKSFKQLFNFSGLMLLSNLTETIVYQVQALIIGRVFSASDLGYYTQAKKLHEIPERAIPQIVDQVTFPILSSIQDDKKKVKQALQINLTTLSFVNFPLMVLLAIIAEPLIIFLFTDRWLPSVPFFQILCLGGMFYGLNSVNVNVVKSLGRSDYIFYLTILKRIVTIIFIIIGIQFGLLEMICGYTLSIFAWYPINVFFSKKLIDYNLIQQVKDISKSYLLSIIVGIISYLLYTTTHGLDISPIIHMIIIIIIYAVLYLGTAKLFNFKEIYYITDIVSKYKKRK